MEAAAQLLHGRLPPGRRGLKRRAGAGGGRRAASPSPRKAWIETSNTTSTRRERQSPSPRKAWIETLSGWLRPRCSSSPSPRKAWIETATTTRLMLSWRMSPSPRKAWIETQIEPGSDRLARKSPSPRKAWIETRAPRALSASATGRLPPGRRGLKPRLIIAANGGGQVAFPPEGVD